MYRSDLVRNGGRDQRSGRRDTGHQSGRRTCCVGNGRSTVGQETKSGNVRAHLKYSGTTGFAQNKPRPLTDDQSMTLRLRP